MNVYGLHLESYRSNIEQKRGEGFLHLLLKGLFHYSAG